MAVGLVVAVSCDSAFLTFPFLATLNRFKKMAPKLLREMKFNYAFITLLEVV